jgi:hypothetical protein
MRFSTASFIVAQRSAARAKKAEAIKQLLGMVCDALRGLPDPEANQVFRHTGGRVPVRAGHTSICR